MVTVHRFTLLFSIALCAHSVRSLDSDVGQRGLAARNFVRRKAISISQTVHNRRSLRSSSDDMDDHDELVASHTSSLATHPDVGLDHFFVPLKQSCHPDCIKRGNCNAEEGRCECPFGYTGRSCEDPLLPACQLGPGMEPFFGVLLPRNCECVRQANRFFKCTPTNDTCTLQSLGFHDVSCYTYKNKASWEQWSVYPALDAQEVEFFRGPMRREVTLTPTDVVEGIIGRDIWNTAYLGLPLEMCGEHKCSNHGACVVEVTDFTLDFYKQRAESNNKYCMCYKGYSGRDCSADMWELCPNKCRGRGRCIRGFCHCDPPFWGLDCGRERAWKLVPGASPVPNRVLLRIYVYELPANIAFPVALDDNVFDLNEPSYQTHRKFLELLLLDNAVRTENPHEANLFFVPANAYAYSSNTNSPANQIEAALDYVATTYPYFNASGGADHFIWTTGDRGSCYLPRRLSKVIHVTLFGLHANLRDNTSTFLRPVPEHHPTWGCYHPKKDVLAAPWYDHMVGSRDAPELYEKVIAAGGADANRNLLFFFAGSVRPKDTSYSGGARQQLYAHLQKLLKSGGNYSDISFVEGYTADYNDLYLRSRFCLAPHGAGFGVRLTLAMTHACIPVIIQDQVFQPYESDGILPYSQFSLRLSKSDIPYIVPILRSIPDDKQKRMRMAMAKYHRAFLWDTDVGGRAYNYTIKALNQRLHGLWGHLWGDPHPERRQLTRVAWDTPEDEWGGL